MPKLKQSPNDTLGRYITATIAKYSTMYGISREELAYALNMSLPTLERRLKKPLNFTVGEMQRWKGEKGNENNNQRRGDQNQKSRLKRYPHLHWRRKT